MEIKFLDELDVRKRDARHWQLLCPFRVYIDGWIVEVPKGFVTDFASVPRTVLAWFVAGGIGDKSAVLHDYFCVTKNVTSCTAAVIFNECLKIEGVPAWRRTLMYHAVRWFGPSF